MGITEDPDPAMATMAKTLPFTTVDTDIPITVDTDIPITVDTDTIVIRTGAGNTPKVTSEIVRQERQGWPLDQAADARGRPISALRRLHRRVRFGVVRITTASARPALGPLLWSGIKKTCTEGTGVSNAEKLGTTRPI